MGSKAARHEDRQHPLLFKINMQAGHGGKSGRFERLRETAIEYQFILTSLTS